MTDTEERLRRLEQRVEYMERELDVSYEQYQFERRMDKIFRDDDVGIEVSDNRVGGYHAFVENLDTDTLNMALDRLQNLEGEVQYEVTESGAGLGMEVWTI